MNLKIRINLIITLLLAFVMALGASVMIDNAREDIRAEVSSTTILALHLLDAEVLHYTLDYDWAKTYNNNQYTIFRLKDLDNVRHLRIEYFDAFGNLRESNSLPRAKEGDAPPIWFIKLISKVSPALKVTHRPIVINNRVLGEFVITPDPSYEIAEIWHDTFGLLGLGMLFFLVVNGVVYWAVHSALRPLSKILNALTQLERGHLEARLPLFSLPELSDISSKFNAMAQTLETSKINNHRLTQRIIRLQEDERKNIAHDLHDEIGQHLTAISIDAATILKAKKISAAHISAAAISEVAKQMMDIVREMLQHLRPVVLDELGLHSSLEELIGTWGQRNQSVSVNANIAGQLDGLNESVEITAYRIVQECLTNIAKYANASLVTIHVNTKHENLLLSIQDNGKGFEQSLPSNGFGLAGMRERVEGLGGKFSLHSDLGAGTRIEVALPLHFKELL